MRKILMLVVMVVMAVVAMAQTPNKISYQAVVRDGQNRLVTNTNVSVQVQIGTSYSETFSVTTNANGLVSLQIPTDAHQTDFNGINWATTNTITTTITIVSTSEAMTSTVPVTAVPYALYANNVNPAAFDVIYDKIYADSLALAGAINTVDAKFDNYMDSLAVIRTVADTAAALRSAMPDAQVQSDWTETNTSSKAYILHKPILMDSATVMQRISDTAGAVRGEVDAKLTEYTKTADLANQIAGQISDTADAVRGEVDAKLTEYTKTADLANQIADQISDTADAVRGEVDTKLADYTKTADLANQIAGQISDTADAVRGEVDAKLADYLDSVAVLKHIADTAAALRAAMPASQLNADWTEIDPDSKAFILHKPIIMDSLAVIRTVADTAGNIRTAMNTMKEKLQENIDSTSANVRSALIDTAAALRAAMPEVGEGKYSLVNPKTGAVVGTILVNANDSTGIVLPGNPLTLKFKRNGNELVAYNAFGGYDFPDVDMSDTSYVIDLKDTITTQAIVKYILAARADTYVNDIDSISRAFRTNVDVKNAIYDTIKAIAMRHEQDALDIALYYFNNISATQMRQILDQLTAASVQNFIDKLNSVLTQADVNNFIDALSHSITPTQVEYLLNALNNKVTPAQVNDFIDALDAAAAHTGTAAWQLKKRLHDYIYSVAHE